VQEIIDTWTRAVGLMLFDLRGRHRRRAVRVIYTGLALLMGVGLSASASAGASVVVGGLLNAANNKEGSSAGASPIRSRSTTSSPRSSRRTRARGKPANAELHEAAAKRTSARRE